MPKQARTLSPHLIAAHHALLQLRAAHRKKAYTGISAKTAVSPHPSSTVDATADTFRLPSHLGWHSQPFSNWADKATSPKVSPHVCETAQPIPQKPQAPQRPPNIPLQPDIAIGLLRHELTAVGRIWLLLRYLDRSGRGWVDAREARAQLTTKQSTTHVCGKRQLRKLLSMGIGIFWQRKNGRIWLRSMPKVAAHLGINKFTSPAVMLPITTLTERIGTVRAHLYASFHSARTHRQSTSNAVKPIARTTIEKITHVQPRIQRLYEKTAGVKPQQNYAVGAPYSAEAAETAGWQRGKAVFPLTDKLGHLGKPGRKYLAWQLPNSYKGPHQLQTSRQKMRLNRALTDLMQKGTPGNGQCTSISINEVMAKNGVRYCENGRLAAKMVQKPAVSTVYWPKPRGRNHRIWHYLPPADEVGTNDPPF